MHRVWHLIWRHQHDHWSRCAEALGVQLLIPLWPSEVYKLPDYMSELVSPALALPTVASYLSLHAISWTQSCFQPVH